MKDIEYLYEKKTQLYDAFSNDRNFLGQNLDILKLSSKKDSCTALELLAGPARHSHAFENLG